MCRSLITGSNLWLFAQLSLCHLTPRCQSRPKPIFCHRCCTCVMHMHAGGTWIDIIFNHEADKDLIVQAGEPGHVCTRARGDCSGCLSSYNNISWLHPFRGQRLGAGAAHHPRKSYACFKTLQCACCLRGMREN